MHPLRHHLRQLSWVAFFAIFGLALVPTISRALAHHAGAPSWADVCTAQGSGAKPANEAPATSAAGLSHLDHCPLCALSSTAVLPPLPTQAWALHPPTSAAVPPLYLQARHTLFAWRSAQPRAPPLLG